MAGGITHREVTSGWGRRIPSRSFNTFQPQLFLVIETFTYTITDARGATATATVTVTVGGNNDPVAVADVVSVVEGAIVDIDPLANDTDVESDPLTLDSFDATTALGITLTQVGSIIQYDSSLLTNSGALAVGETLTDTFSYTIYDGNGGTNTNTVTVTINGLNDLPTGVDDACNDSRIW